jgi:tRNA modification GTPase
VVRTKCDMTPCSPLPARCSPLLETSAVTGAGICRLKEAIRAAALQAAGPKTDVVVGTAVRCSESLRLAAASLARAREAVGAGLGEELIASEVRVALTELGKVAGAVYTDDVLDRIFSRFCIGK